ncbi:hydrogenase maturation nickel metallochaperone HypA [Archaeoglobus veneficus]|uniref:Hydrogenase maturation factor HypA n=1 Tax=Archaeoglobus veneficus (strain DSM 11195 / SNP6) TaxID=693661 RepID=F2KN99_ARCVS|nr:hydrogenase maturation nickel metallochaperone HypA [Archaeoglobus veneficus]AEA46200.1 hydrogenase nickel insertion protein HypA [Archaeoglobus veneficus SNP6]
MSFAQAIVENVLKLAEEKGAKKVSKVLVEMGELLLINPEQLEFCFQVASSGTIAEGAVLELEFIKPHIECLLCGKRYDEPIAICECGGIIKVEGGKDMVIRKIEMEV